MVILWLAGYFTVSLLTVLVMARLGWDFHATPGPVLTAILWPIGIPAAVLVWIGIKVHGLGVSWARAADLERRQAVRAAEEAKAEADRARSEAAQRGTYR